MTSFKMTPTKCSLLVGVVVCLLVSAEASSGTRTRGAVRFNREMTVKDNPEDLLAMESSNQDLTATASDRSQTIVPAPGSDDRSPITTYALPPVSDTKTAASDYVESSTDERIARRRPVLVLRPRIRSKATSSDGVSEVAERADENTAAASEVTGDVAAASHPSGQVAAYSSASHQQHYQHHLHQYQQQQQINNVHLTQASAALSHGSAPPQQYSTIHHQAQASDLLQNHQEFTSIDKHQKEQRHPHGHHAPHGPHNHVAAAPHAPPHHSHPPPPPHHEHGPQGPPPPPVTGAGGVGYHKANIESDAENLAESELNKEHQQLVNAIGSGLELYKNALKNPVQLAKNVLLAFSKFSVPKDHYLNVVSFVGIYLFMSILFYGSDDIMQLTCEAGPQPHGQKEWHYHVGRRFVPGMPVDPKLQLKFLELFRGMHLDDDDGGDGGSSSSSEEMSSGELHGVNDHCPRGAFFYAMAPMHLEARMQLQRLFVGVHSPEDVYVLAKDLLYKHRVHPKIWYLALLGAAVERPDMTGFQLAHPIDAIPDWFIPAEYIKDEMEKHRSLLRSKRLRRAIDGNSTLVITTMMPDTVNNSTTFIPPTSTRPTRPPSRKPYTRPPTIDSGSMESSSHEFVLDGFGNKGERGDLLTHDEDAINNSIRNYEYRQNYKVNSKKRIPPPPPSGAAATNEEDNDDDNDEEDRGDENEDEIDNESDEASNEVEQDDKHKKKSHNKKNNHGHGKKKGHKKGHKGKGSGDSEEDDKCIVVDGRIGKDNGIENKLWYYREDVMVNQQHFYWHLTHPLNATNPSDHPDRRGELFFYVHRSFLARYNAERISNGLEPTVQMRFGPGGFMLEPYNSHLVDFASGKPWTPRHPKRQLRDIMHEHNPDISGNIMLRDVATLYSRVLTSIKAGLLLAPKGLVPIRNTKGVEPLTNTVEASELSVNPAVYDAMGIHNLGHLIIGLVEDPEWHHKIPPGVMADTATAMRDPIFYNYHFVIDNIIEKYKATLPAYKVVGGEFPLLWKGVEIEGVELISKGNSHPNQLRTFWTKKKFELAPSVDHSTGDKDGDHANICAVHLAHEPFTFKITIDRKPCTRSKTGKGTIRIFMAPRYDAKGRRFPLHEQRRLMFQLDAFQAKLRVGKNIITRRSHDSSLTKPWTRSLRDYEHGPDPSGAADFCGCGWPQHLYIPKGNQKGMPFDLFVMVTNYDEDRVQNDPKSLEIPETCNSPYIFCGHPRRRYPDARPMGYPFDRPTHKQPIPCHPGYSFAAVACKSFNLVFYKTIDTLEEFVSKAPNMKSLVFDIKHVDKLIGNYYH